MMVAEAARMQKSVKKVNFFLFCLILEVSFLFSQMISDGSEAYLK